MQTRTEDSAVQEKNLVRSHSECCKRLITFGFKIRPQELCYRKIIINNKYARETYFFIFPELS